MGRGKAKPGGPTPRKGGGKGGRRPEKHAKKNVGASHGSGKGSKANGKAANSKATKTAKGDAVHGSERQKGIKRKTESDPVAAEPETEKKKKKAVQSVKRQKKKEVTAFYSELINPGRERKPDVVVGDILQLLAERETAISEYSATQIGSRVLQACLKWGSMDQRRQLLIALKEHLPKMALNRYGHVVVLKLLVYVAKTSEQRKPTEKEKKTQAQNLRDFLEGFRGKHLHSMFYHKSGCRVFNGIYFNEAVGTKDKRRLLHAIAVPATVALTRPELPESLPLRKLLNDESLSKEHKAAIVSHLFDATEKCLDKELLAFDVVHLLFQAYCEAASEQQLKELAGKCLPGAPNLLSSKPGAEATLRLLGLANAKERKAFIKDLKGKFVALATNAVDYVVVMRLASTVDDTVLLVKSMLAEWFAELGELCFDKYGHKAIIWILKPDDTRYFSPYERECLALPAPSSLKASETRRQELLRALKPEVRKVLLEDALKAAADVHAKDVLLAYLSAEWDAEVVEALVASSEVALQESDCGSLNTGTVATTLLVLLKMEPEGAEPSLSEALWNRCFEPRLPAASSSRCAFVLLAMLKGHLREQVLKAVRSRRSEVAAAVDAAEAKGCNVSGARTLLSAVDEAAPA